MNIYSTVTARDSFVSKNVPVLQAGVHENIVMSSISVDKTTHGTTYIKFSYVDEQGMIASHSEFEPTKRHYEDDASFKTKSLNQMNRMINNHMVPYFGYADGIKMTDDAFKTSTPQYDGPTFLGFATWLKETIEEIAKTTKIRAKFVYDNKNWIGLPNYSSYVSVEPMTASKREITLLGIDKVERSVVDDESLPVGDPFSNVTPSTSTMDSITATNPLPF